MIPGFNLLEWDNLITLLWTHRRIQHAEYLKWKQLFGKRFDLLPLPVKPGSAKERNTILKEINAIRSGFDEDAFKRKAIEAFYGFRYPSSESAVVFAFGKFCQLMEIYFDKVVVRPDYPDAIVTREDQTLNIEFEKTSKGFQRDKHDPEKCDVIVSWKHDWESCPLDVLELSGLVLISRENESKGSRVLSNRTL